MCYHRFAGFAKKVVSVFHFRSVRFLPGVIGKSAPVACPRAQGELPPLLAPSYYTAQCPSFYRSSFLVLVLATDTQGCRVVTSGRGGRLHVPGGYAYSSAPHSAAAAAKGRGEGGGVLPQASRRGCWRGICVRE